MLILAGIYLKNKREKREKEMKLSEMKSIFKLSIKSYFLC